MSFISNLFRCLCLCIVIEKGTWSPNEGKKAIRKNKEVVKRQLYNKKSPKIEKIDPTRPAWLNEWTISKGWVHNKSHMLELGANQNVQKMAEGKNYEILSETSSISSQNIDELISLESNTVRKFSSKELAVKEESIDLESEESAEYSSDEDDETIRVASITTKQETAAIFEKVSENYRNNFPDAGKSHVIGSLELPQVYKEQLLLREKKDLNILQEIWRQMKPKRHKTSRYDCRYTESKIYSNNDIFNTLKSFNSDTPSDTCKAFKKTNLAKNIALYNDLNSRRNLHEETIYECSEENSNHTSLNNIYFNPIYSQNTNQMISVYDRRIEQYQRHLRGIHDKNDRSKMKSDKYVIRHIRVRFMLSLRVGKVHKAKKPREKRKKFLVGRKKHSNRKALEENSSIHSRVSKMHDEQRRIGNGKTSIKIQNMRYVLM